MSFPYQPYYCEENAYALLTETPIDGMDPYMLFITNDDRRVMMFQQAAGAEPSGAIIWDYHVVVLTAKSMEVWDQDSVAGFPLPLEEYLELSFGPSDLAPQTWRPQFRLLSRAAAKSNFSTDRSHMRDANGEFLQPPPPWDPPTNGEANLEAVLDTSRVDPPEFLPWLNRSDLLNWASDN